MTKVSKMLIVLGAAAMSVTPVVASASGATLPAMLAGGGTDGDGDNYGGVGIAALAALAAALGVLIASNSNSR